MQFLDSVLMKILPESYRDEAIGDLWEADHNMKVNNTPCVLRGLVILWRALLLVAYSVFQER